MSPSPDATTEPFANTLSPSDGACGGLHWSDEEGFLLADEEEGEGEDEEKDEEEEEEKEG